MGSLIEELKRREEAARAEADQLRSRMEQVARDLAEAEERVSRLVIAQEEVARVLEEPASDAGPPGSPVGAVSGQPGGGRRSGRWRCRSGGRILRRPCCRGHEHHDVPGMTGPRPARLTTSAPVNPAADTQHSCLRPLARSATASGDHERCLPIPPDR